MELTFDIKGHLVPYQRLELSFEDFESFFIDSFDVDSTRTKIFQNYKRFIHDFAKEITPNFKHWIDGSFVTNKMNPRDIDFVSLIDHDIYEGKRELIDNKFRLSYSKKIYEVDAYTLEIYPEEHKKYSISKIDLVYWDNWFSKTKKDRRKKSFPKGYIEIEFKV